MPKFDAELSRRYDRIIVNIEAISALPDSEAKRKSLAQYYKAKAKLEREMR